MTRTLPDIVQQNELLCDRFGPGSVRRHPAFRKLQSLGALLSSQRADSANLARWLNRTYTQYELAECLQQLSRACVAGPWLKQVLADGRLMVVAGYFGYLTAGDLWAPLDATHEPFIHWSLHVWPYRTVFIYTLEPRLPPWS